MEKEQLSGDNLFIIRHFLTPEECAAFIAQSEGLGYSEAPITTAFGFQMRKDVRDNARVILDDFDLAARLGERARPFLPAVWKGWELVGFNERFRFYRYDPGQRFAPHRDGSFWRDNGEESQLTFMIYLNDSFQGGTTNFYETKPQERVIPEAGMALVFAHRQLHEGAPVEQGRKYVLRTDVMYLYPMSRKAKS
jgi:predicted 2-oxoglutarate/Fe(II)-dependent dioxygenase YbiX